MPTILIVDDNPKIRRLLELFLKAKGFEILLAEDGSKVESILESHLVNLIIADIMMPKLDGYQLIKMLRENRNQIPVLIITAKGEFTDKKQGFDLGADDYMTKPLDIEELLLRVKALLRRSNIFSENKIVFGKIIVDQNDHKIQTPDFSISLPQKEFHLLYQLLSYPEKIFTRQELMDTVWEINSNSTSRTVDVHINRLREHLADIKEFEICTVRGVGYKAVLHMEVLCYAKRN